MFQKKAKYIVLETPSGLLIPVICSELFAHDEMARNCGVYPGGPGGTVVGAGFCFIEDNRYHCYGSSYSLQIDSRGDVDAAILNKELGIDVDD